MPNSTNKFIIRHNIIERSGMMQCANTELITHVIDQCNWKKVFLNKNVFEKVIIFKEIILNMLKKA